MPHALRIGAAIDPNDSYWVQVREAAYARADQLPLDLISISLMDDPQALPSEKHEALLEELLALELDALIAWSLPEDLTYRITQSGIPLVLLSETPARHPLLASPSGLYEIAQMGISYLAERLADQSHVLAIDSLERTGWQDSEGMIVKVRQAFKSYPHVVPRYVTIAGRGLPEQIYSEVYRALQQINGSVDAIFGLSDHLALAARDQVGRSVSLAHAR